MHGGATVYDAQKTTMGRATPSYGPQSQWGGQDDNFDNGNDGGAYENMPVPGSTHFQNENYSKDRM